MYGWCCSHVDIETCRLSVGEENAWAWVVRSSEIFRRVGILWNSAVSRVGLICIPGWFGWARQTTYNITPNRSMDISLFAPFQGYSRCKLTQIEDLHCEQRLTENLICCILLGPRCFQFHTEGIANHSIIPSIWPTSRSYILNLGASAFSRGS